MDAERPITIANLRIAPRVELGVRSNAGDADTGTGVDAGAGVRVSAGPLDIDLSGHRLVFHDGTLERDWGVELSVSFTPRDNGRGLGTRIAPRWGHGARTDRLGWSPPSTPGTAASSQAGLEAEIGYGVRARAGLLRPFAGVSMWNPNRSTVRAGIEWTRRENLTLGLDLASERGRIPDQTLDSMVFRAQLRF